MFSLGLYIKQTDSLPTDNFNYKSTPTTLFEDFILLFRL